MICPNCKTNLCEEGYCPECGLSIEDLKGFENYEEPMGEW